MRRGFQNGLPMPRPSSGECLHPSGRWRNGCAVRSASGRRRATDSADPDELGPRGISLGHSVSNEDELGLARLVCIHSSALAQLSASAGGEDLGQAGHGAGAGRGRADPSARGGIAQEHKIVQGRRMRVDTTVVGLFSVSTAKFISMFKVRHRAPPVQPRRARTRLVWGIPRPPT